MNRYIAIAWIVTFLAAPAVLAQQDESYADRREYDPETGRWVSIASPVPGTEDGDLELARSRLARGEYKKARKLFKHWLRDYSDSARRGEALFYAADTEVSAEEAKRRRGDLMKAYGWYEELIEGWGGTDLADRAIRRELIIAEMFLFKHRKQRVLRGLMWLGATEEALTMLDRIIDEWAPKTAIAEQALRLKADYHFVEGEFKEAETAYARLARDYPRGRYHRVAMLRSGEAALARFPGVEFDDADLLESEVYFQDFQQQYPRHAAEAAVAQTLARIRESRARKDYTVGHYYERTNKINAAAFYYRLVVESWPETTWAVEARRRLVALGAVEPDPYEEDMSAGEGSDVTAGSTVAARDGE
ncbi:MAG: outer membrane protein assembly factor BamD [Phycisphaerae bacterium]